MKNFKARANKKEDVKHMQLENISTFFTFITLLKYTFEVLVLYLSISMFCYSITVQWEILYFLLHYIYLLTLVTNDFSNFQTNYTKYKST